jgi:competence protein ComEC
VLYGQSVVLLTRLLLKTTSIVAAIPTASRPVPQVSWALLIGVTVAAVYLLRSQSRKHWVGRLSIVAMAISCAMALDIPLTRSVLADKSRLWVEFADVGQGDCILIHTPGGKNFIVDCGPSSRSGVARVNNALLPLLRAEAYTDISAIFISHMHRDHYGGVPTLLNSTNVAAIYSSGERASDPLARKLDSMSVVKNVTRRVLARGDRLQLDSEVQLYVLHPGREEAERMKTKYGSHANAGSLVFKLCYGSTSFLFLGDVERSEEELMKEEYADFLRSSVVKVAHHGSLTSSSRAFGELVRPGWAVISVGDNNRFGHPAQAIVRRWNGLGAKVARTDLDGAVLFASDGHTVERKNWRESKDWSE